MCRSSAAIRSRGTRQSRTRLAGRRNTLRTYSAWSRGKTPARRVSSMIRPSSSTEWTIWWPLIGSKPSSRTTPLPMPFITAMNGPHHGGEPQQRPGDPQADRVGPLQRDGLGRQFAQDHVQERDQREGDDRGQRVRRDPATGRRARNANSGVDQPRHDGSPTQPKRQAGQRDAQLRGGDRVVEVLDGVLDGQRRPRGDALTISSTRVRRTATSANSAATKNAFTSTNSGTAKHADEQLQTHRGRNLHKVGNLAVRGPPGTAAARRLQNLAFLPRAAAPGYGRRSARKRPPAQFGEACRSNTELVPRRPRRIDCP